MTKEEYDRLGHITETGKCCFCGKEYTDYGYSTWCVWTAEEENEAFGENKRYYSRDLYIRRYINYSRLPENQLLSIFYKFNKSFCLIVFSILKIKYKTFSSQLIPFKFYFFEFCFNRKNCIYLSFFS